MKSSKVLVVLLSLLMVCVLVPSVAFAESENVAKIGETSYSTLQEAVTAAKSGETIKLLKDTSGDGIKSQADDNFVLDLGGYTYTITKTVGSKGTETNGLQLLRGGKVTIKNGAFDFANAKIGIKNYADLTLENVNLKSNAASYPVINNCGTLTVNGEKTVITGPFEWSITTGNYTKGVVVTTTVNAGQINGVGCETPLWEIGGATENESVTTTINGGNIGKVGEYDWRSLYGGSYLNAPVLENCKAEIYGGIFGEDISKYLAKGYNQTLQNGKYVVAPAAAGITLSKSSVNMEVGSSETLTAVVEPKDTLDKVAFATSDSKVATVDNSGKITAVDAGSAKITATVNGKAAECDVTVYKIEEPVVPTLDTAKPVEKVEVGVSDKEDKAAVESTTASIVEDVAGGKAVSEEVMSEETAQAVKEAIEEGKTITSEVQTKTVDKNALPDEVVKKVDEMVNSMESKDQVVVAQYLDLSVILKADGEEIGNINKLEDKITFKIAIPDNLNKEGREFFVICVHENADGTYTVEKLPAAKNADGTLSISTDKFSTYALAYEDSKQAAQAENAEQKEDTESNDQPKTGDSSNAMALLLCMMLSALGVVIAGKKATK